MLPQAPPTTAVQPPPVGTRLVVRTRVLDGILTGGAAAVLAGVAWWALATFTELDWWQYGAAGVGLVVGAGTLVGARKGGLVPGIIALAFATVATVLGAYFIDRSLTIAGLEDVGRTSDIPLWNGFGEVTAVITDWIDFDLVRAAGWVLGPLLALVVAVAGRRN